MTNKKSPLIQIDLSKFYQETGTAKLSLLDEYETRALSLAGEGNHIELTGAAPIWLYLRIAHVLHGKAIKLTYKSPATQNTSITVFDHNPF